MSSTPLTNLIDNRVLARVERMRLASSRRFTDRRHGENVARRGGTSTEFRDYRDYVEGDDTRFVDWNIYARLRRPYVKLFHDQEELTCAILIDASTSMQSEGKLQRARQLAAALGVSALMGGDRLCVYGFGGDSKDSRRIQRLRPLRGRGGMRDLLRFCEGVACTGAVQLEVGIEEMLRVHQGRGTLVILSDFLSQGDLRGAINRSGQSGQQVFGLQILGPAELAPELADDLRLVDSETGDTVDVSASPDLIALYHEHRLAHEKEVAGLCRRTEGRFSVVDASAPIEEVLFTQLRVEKWLR